MMLVACCLVFLILIILVRFYRTISEILKFRSELSGKLDEDFLSDRCDEKSRRPIKSLIVAGSGGHTAEILKLVQVLGEGCKYRDYIVADTDTISCKKISSLEEKISSKDSQIFSSAAQSVTMSVDTVGDILLYSIIRIQRSREVQQSWITTISSTLRACFQSLAIVLKSSPDLLLCNGPGTCVPVCGAAFLFRVLGITRTKIIFIESVCRVTSMSLTGRILYYFSDHMIVQWEELQKKYPKTTYLGRIV